MHISLLNQSACFLGSFIILSRSLLVHLTKSGAKVLIFICYLATCVYTGSEHSSFIFILSLAILDRYMSLYLFILFFYSWFMIDSARCFSTMAQLLSNLLFFKLANYSILSYFFNSSISLCFIWKIFFY